MKVPLAEFQGMTVAQRIEYLIDLVPHSPGVGGGLPRLEALLSKVGLGGSVHPDLRRTLIELHQTRNVYAHRGGLADRKAVAACPWRKDWKVGKQILVGSEAYRHYYDAIQEYVVELIARSSTPFGVDRMRLEERTEKARKEEQARQRRRRRAAINRETKRMAQKREEARIERERVLERRVRELKAKRAKPAESEADKGDAT